MGSQKKTAKIVRWIARIWGGLIILFVLSFFLADVLGGEQMVGEPLSTKDKITFAFFPLGTIVGLVLAWKWEGVGGLITVLAMIGLLIIRPDLLSSFYFIAIGMIPGLLFIGYWYLSRNAKDPITD